GGVMQIAPELNNTAVMRVLLRHVRTGYYYNGRQEWVVEKSEASHARSIEQALQMIINDQLDGMSLIIIYDESGAEEVLDLSCEDSNTPIIPLCEVTGAGAK